MTSSFSQGCSQSQEQSDSAANIFCYLVWRCSQSRTFAGNKDLDTSRALLQWVVCCTVRTMLTQFLQLVVCDMTTDPRGCLYQYKYSLLGPFHSRDAGLPYYLRHLMGSGASPKKFPHLQWRAVQPFAVQTSRAASLLVAESRLLLCLGELSKAARSTPKFCGGNLERLGECSLGPIKSAYLAEAGR